VADVTVVGAGPVGMLLAGDLARRGVDVEVLERLKKDDAAAFNAMDASEKVAFITARKG